MNIKGPGRCPTSRHTCHASLMTGAYSPCKKPGARGSIITAPFSDLRQRETCLETQEPASLEDSAPFAETRGPIYIHTNTRETICFLNLFKKMYHMSMYIY